MSINCVIRIDVCTMSYFIRMHWNTFSKKVLNPNPSASDPPVSESICIHTHTPPKIYLTLMIYFKLQKCPNSKGARLSWDHSHPVWFWTVGCHSGMWHIDSGRNLKLDPLLPVFISHIWTLLRWQTSYWQISHTFQIIWFPKIHVNQLR